MFGEKTDEKNESDQGNLDALPSENALPEIKIYGHSSLLYWWPVWLAALVAGVYTVLFGETVSTASGARENLLPNAGVGVAFTALLLATIIFTNVKMRGTASVVMLLAIALVVVTLAYIGVWDEIAAAVPALSIHMDAGFYLVFGAALLMVWLLQFFVFDRLVYYRVRPGQLIEERVIGGGERSFDADGLLFEQKDDDFFRHRVLGLGAGDLTLTTSDARNATITIENVLFAERRVGEIQRLIAVKPDDVRAPAPG